ncbi:hypothetical protein [Vulcanisaeta sp. JCM 16161]|uniref:hypothetical protein n=1 Tax=Vulcanisaeta sp. JCM 16161 TaxID=1295372 RepID=UPI000A63467B|nr:hypothetical protein [Vulcanisaeta sp. JCM 16161]
MSIESVLREVIEEWFAFNLPRVIPRDISYLLPEGSALALVGPRRPVRRTSCIGSPRT